MSGESWRPLASRDIAKSRAGMLGRAREFFESRGVLEVDTPVLSRFPVSDPHIESLSAGAATAPELFLHTSPEYRMKQLLAAGFGDIYQVCKVFRGGERGPHHLPEFTLVEWYRLGFGLQAMMRETVEFIATVLDRSEYVERAAFVAYDELMRQTVNIDARTAAIGELAGSANADAELERSIGDDRNAWLDLVMTDRVLPQLAQDSLTVIFHYPAGQAALARICPGDAAVADRFEVFFGTLELGNGFVELADANEQLSRFTANQDARRSNGMAVHPLDEDLIDALRAGLPDCAGVAVGFDRLLMLKEGKSDIAAVSNFVV